MRIALLLAGKDLRVLARSRVLLALLVLYPIALALIVGQAVLAPGEPKIALVNKDTTGDDVQIGTQEFSLTDYVRRAESGGVDVVELDEDEAMRALEEGQVAGVLVIPQGTIAKLGTQLSSVDLEFHVSDSALGEVVAQRLRGVVYNINLRISEALIETNREYLDVLVNGGEAVVQGDSYDLLGLGPAEEELAEAREDLDQIAEVEGVDEDDVEDMADALADVGDFADDASSAITLAVRALEATAAPVRIDRVRAEGASPRLSAQGMSFGLAVLVSFASMVLVAASLAGERDERVLGRLLRGLASRWQVLVGKLVLGALLAVLFSVGLFVVFTLLEPRAWTRLPLLLAAVVVASLAASAIGALVAVLVRDARGATLAAILIVLPMVPFLLVQASGPVGWLVEAMPLAPSRRLFNVVLFELDPWPGILRHSAQLLAIAAVATAASVPLLRRLT